MDEYLKHFLYPAALFVNSKPYEVSTILGSCVAVCLWDPYTQIGGINHYMLPLWNGQGLASPKYGNIAIQKLLEKLLALGCKKHNLRAKVFGGAEVIDTNVTQFHIGQRNIVIAFDMLAEEKIPVLSSSVGGKHGRKIIFFTNTGEVMQRYVSSSNQKIKPEF